MNKTIFDFGRHKTLNNKNKVVGWDCCEIIGISLPYLTRCIGCNRYIYYSGCKPKQCKLCGDKYES